MVSLNLETFFSLQLVPVYDLLIDGDMVHFSCDKKIIKRLDNEKITYQKEDRLKALFTNHTYRVSISLIFLFFISMIFLINQFFIREISFNDPKYHNNVVYNYVESYTSKVGPYIILKDSIANISSELRKKFYQYAYIGLNKRGSKLIIEIAYQDVKDNNDAEIKSIGEYYATTDAIISYVNMQSGQVLVKYKDVVKAGDLIATSNLQYAENLYSVDKMVPLTGEILGEVKEYYEIEILKKENVEIFTGENRKFYSIHLFNKIFFAKKDVYEKNYYKMYSIFQLGNFRIVKNTIYEKANLTLTRTKEDAREYAIIQIYQDYESKRISEKEKIHAIELVNYVEYDNKYYFKFIISACKNIVKFKPF